jgi:hypothetical protein
MLLIMDIIIERYEEFVGMGMKITQIVEIFRKLDPATQATIIAVLLWPFALLPHDMLSTPPETVCPYLGVAGIAFDDYPASDCIVEVAYLSYICVATVVMIAGEILVCLCKDILCKYYDLPICLLSGLFCNFDNDWRICLIMLLPIRSVPEL